MAILFIKASQLGLFEKLVPVKASVRSDGTVVAPHTAIRHVAHHAPAKPKDHHPQVQDLFSRPAAPEPVKAEAPEPVEAVAPKPKRTPKPKPAPEPVAAVVEDKPEAEAPSPSIAAPGPLDGGLDYSAGLPEFLPEFGVQPGVTKGERRALNARAAAMVNGKVELFGADQEPVDNAVLRQYSGWGGCGDSLNEFYTDTRVAAAMWAVLHRLGAVGEGAQVLEPSCGTGVFMATAPAGVKVIGVELDETSSKIAGVLHPGHEVHNSSLEAFATTDMRQYDSVIGNPPFGDSRGSLVAADKPDIKRPEQYFTDTALDKCRPGGVVALVLPTGIMDSTTGRKVRDRLIRKGQFLGALRMPNTAFEASHTGVTTDVVFFRKRPDDVAGALSVLDIDTLKRLDAWDDEFVGGGYFEGRGEGNVLGTVEAGWRAKAGMGDDITVAGSMLGVADTIAEFEAPEPRGPASVADVLAVVSDAALQARVRGAAARKPYDQAKRGDTRNIDGVLYVLEGEPLRWHRVDEFMAEKAVIDAAALGAEIERALQDDGYAAANGLADKVRAFVEEHGIPAKNPNLVIAAKQDKLIYRLIGAVKPDGSLSDVVSGKSAAPVASSFDAAAQTLALEVGFFTPAMVTGRWHAGTEDSVLDHLYASEGYVLDPTSGTWTSLDNYLTGELWPKLDVVKAALAGEDLKPEDRAKFERQAAALEAEIDPKSLEDVEVMVNSGFVPLPVVAAFFNETHPGYKGAAPMAISYDEGYFAVTGGGYAAHTLSKYLNRDGVRKDDDLPTIERWNREFKTWLCASEFRDEVEDDYNRKFRGFRQKAYSDAPFEVPGLNDEGLKSYQWSGLRWALEAGKGIIAADVGLGKTARALILNKLMKSTGQARRPMIVVPKSVAANWMREAQKWFPGSSVMVIGETYTRDKKTGELKGRPDNAVERARKFHDITQNDYDFILITQPAWNELDLNPELKDRYASDDFWEKRKKSMGKDPSAKQLARQKEAHDAKVAGQDFLSRTDAIYFDGLGVDAIISDEMHAYKNLFAARDRFGKSPRFLGGSANSKRAADMRYKTQWLRDQTGGRNVYGLTATPTKNSPLEVYSMLSHIAPEAFERIGIRNSEDFLDRYCVFEDRNILDTSGRMTRELCVTGFKNMGELREIMRRYIDRKTAADVGLPLPARDDRQHMVDISAEQKTVYAHLRQLADDAKNSKEAASGEGHPFAIMSAMDKATLDLELYNSQYAGSRSPKMDAAATQVAEGFKDGGQVIFCDAIGAHQKFVDMLVEKGVPRDQIGVMNAQVAATSAQRQNIAEAYRARKLRVVIGNSTMEEGVDGLQEGTVDIHHLNIPWTPATIQQRNGRGLRQGNTAEAIRIHNYLAKGTFDGYRYQTISAKKDWQTLLWEGGDKVENLAFEGGLGHEEMLIALSEDPDAAREQLAKNKALAQSKLDAEQHTSAAEDFASYRAMKASLGKLDAKGREKPSGQRLEFKLGRLKTALEANPYFKPKHALEGDKPVMIQAQTGHAFEPGGAFEVSKDGKITAGRYVVEALHPDHKLVQVRRYGETGRESKLSVTLDDLAHGVSPVEHDAAAEDAHVAARTAEALAAGTEALTKYEQLRGLPAAAIEANHDAIRTAVKEGMRNYKFGGDRGHQNHVGVIGPNGPAALENYNSAKIGDDQEPMLPLPSHRKMAFDAYAADEAQKKFKNVAIPGRRGSYTGKTESRLQYPANRAYDDQRTNRWEGVINDLWGPEGVAEAQRQSESQALTAARRAPTLKEAIGHALPTSIKRPSQYATPAKSQWNRKALATLWAKAKATGALNTPLVEHLEHKEVRTGNGWGGSSTVSQRPVLAEDHFSDGRTYGSVINHPVRHALSKLAIANGHHDLASAMAVDGAASPEEAHANVLALPESPHRTTALEHLRAKHPHLPEEPAVAA